MKKLLFSSAVLAGMFMAAQAQQLNYTQVTSSGLTAVTFEIGFTELELGDIDGDGDLDIVTIGDHGSPNINATEGGIMVFKNNGTGTSWSMVKNGSFGYGGIALGDVNKDGKMDVGMGMHHNYASSGLGSQLIEVALGNGTGSSWTQYSTGLASNGETYGMFGVDFADVNNDGLLDLASNSFGCCSGIHVYKNNGNGSWTQTDGANAGNSHLWTKFGDFDNDGNVDLTTANELGFIWKNDGTGFFNKFENGYNGEWYVEYDVADVNNDGAKDIGLIDYNGAAQVYYYSKVQSKWMAISSGLPTIGCVGISLNDMDMDGNCDAVIWNAGFVAIYKGDGFGNWTQAGSFTIAETQLASIRTGDFDHDGYCDIAYMAKTSAFNSDNMLRVYLHTVDNPVLNILPVNPKGFECFKPGSVQFVNWQSSVPSGPNATVTIEFSSSGNSGPWTVIASNLPNNGTYQWTVPNVSSPNCFLRYTITQNSNSQSVILSNAFGIGTCTTPPTATEELPTMNFNFEVYPNPIAAAGYLHFKLETSADVKIELLDMLGNEAAVILNEKLNAGFYNPVLRVENLPAGVYFCKMTAGGRTAVQKIVIAK